MSPDWFVRYCPRQLDFAHFKNHVSKKWIISVHVKQSNHNDFVSCRATVNCQIHKQNEEKNKMRKQEDKTFSGNQLDVKFPKKLPEKLCQNYNYFEIKMPISYLWEWGVNKTKKVRINQTSILIILLFMSKKLLFMSPPDTYLPLRKHFDS
jgi:hypothetical protein